MHTRPLPYSASTIWPVDVSAPWISFARILLSRPSTNIYAGYGRIDWTARTAVLDMLEGATDRAAAEKFGLHHRSAQERYDAEIVAIEAKFGQYCSEFWQPRQKRPAPGYNNSIESRLPADVDHGAEAARYRRAEAASYLTGQEWLRDAYRALAEHFERGGHIFYGFTAHGVAPGLYDGRSGKQVLKDAGVVEPEELFQPKVLRPDPDPDKECYADTGIRLALGEVIHGIEADDAPIREHAGQMLRPTSWNRAPLFNETEHDIT